MQISIRLFVSILIAFSLQLFAQTTIESGKPGVKLKIAGGLNSSKLTNENTLSAFGPFDNPLSSFSGGITAEYPLNTHSSLGVGVRYATSGAESEKNTGSDATGAILGEFWFVRELQFIEIPVQFIYQFNSSKITPQIFAGPNIGFLIAAEERIDSDYGEDPRKSDIKELINTINLSAEIGIGLDYRLNDKISLGVSTLYLYGLTNQVKKDTQGTQKTRDFRVFGSLNYRLK